MGTMAGSQALDQALNRLRREFARAVWAGELCRWAGALLLVGGAVALLLRALFGVEPSVAAWALAPLAAAPFVAAVRARRRVPSTAALATWLDRRGGGSGALVTALEQRGEAWFVRLIAPLDLMLAGVASGLGLRWRLLAARVVPGAAFAALALLTPLPKPDAARAPDLLAQRMALELRGKLEALEESVTLEERVAEELERRLERLERPEDRAPGDEAFLEAADGLRERMESLAREAAESAQKARERFAEAGAAAQSEDAATSPEEVASAAEAKREALERALEQLRESGLAPELGAELAKLAAGLPTDLKGIELDAETLAKLAAGLDAETLAKLAAQLDASLARALSGLELANLLDLDALKAAAELKPLAELLEELHKCDDSCREGGT